MGWTERESTGLKAAYLFVPCPSFHFPKFILVWKSGLPRGVQTFLPFPVSLPPPGLPPHPRHSGVASMAGFRFRIFPGAPSVYWAQPWPSLLPSSSFPSSLLCSKARISSQLWTNKCKERILIDRTYWSPNFLPEALARSALIGGMSPKPSDFT